MWYAVKRLLNRCWPFRPALPQGRPCLPDDPGVIIHGFDQEKLAHHSGSEVVVTADNLKSWLSQEYLDMAQGHDEEKLFGILAKYLSRGSIVSTGSHVRAAVWLRDESSVILSIIAHPRFRGDANGSTAS